jgi:hypothetical protein
MGYSLKRWQSFMSKGLSLFTPDFTEDITLAPTSYNVVQGIRQGMGPRFGMSPIPGQCSSEAAAGACAGLLGSEEGAKYKYINRSRFFGVIPMTLYSEAADKNLTHFMWVVGKPSMVDAVLGSSYPVFKLRRDPDIAAGLSPSNTKSATLSTLNPAFFLFDKTNVFDPAVKLTTFLSMSSAKYFLSSSILSVSGKDNPANWIIARAGATAATTTHSASANLVLWTTYTLSPFYLAGRPTGLFSRNSTSKVRSVSVFNLRSLATADRPEELNAEYQYDDFDPSVMYHDPALGDPTTGQDYTQEDMTPGTATRRVDRTDGAAADYNKVQSVLINDSCMSYSSAYQAALLATGEKAIVAVVQDWLHNTDNTNTQWLDLTMPLGPLEKRTTYDDLTSGFYTENGFQKQTCWSVWPAHLAGTALAKSSVTAFDGRHVLLGDANSGILRVYTTYEFTSSMYNKRLGYESNVGAPARIRTGSDDYVALSLRRPIKSKGADLQFTSGGAMYAATLPRPNTYLGIPFSLPLSQAATQTLNINEIEYRVYYRELGSFEWLPALTVDAAKYWFYTNFGELWACEGAIAGLPGGQTGGFNDYSLLPKDAYDCVLAWRNRAWWLSKKSLVFSLENNIFAYPARNSVACPYGEFRGAIVHAFPGQSEQRGRLIIFGSTETYIGYFDGNPQQYPIQVSPDIIGQYPLDGSDFKVDRWTTVTAFSQRAAVVAEGNLYFWGPKGVYRDNGTEFPDRLSYDIEPDVFSLHDPNKTEEIFGHYIQETKEIWWFYPPTPSTTSTVFLESPYTTDALVYNILTNKFVYCRFNCKIDSMQALDISNTDTSRRISGARHIASVRQHALDNLQRAYFFDARNRCGDMEPTKDMVVKSVDSTIAAGRVRLTLASGTDAASLAALVAGDKLLVHQYSNYTERSDWPDFVGVVYAKTATYIDVTFPTSFGPVYPSVSFNLTEDKLMPIWTSRHNKIPFNLATTYWAPGGMNWWAYWAFLHHQYKVALIADNAGPLVNLSSRTPISAALVTRSVTLVNNSDGNCQLYSHLLPTDQGFEGQALKLAFAGDYLGHDWTMQFVGVDCIPLADGDYLQHFEG